MEYEDDDKQYLEFESNRRDNGNAFDGVIVAFCITAIIATVAWIMFF